jgi:hypothetical protein
MAVIVEFIVLLSLSALSARRRDFGGAAAKRGE